MLLVLNNSVTNEIKLLRYKTVAKKEREDHMKKNQFRQSICFALLCGCMMFAGAGEARADYEDLTGPEMESGAYVASVGDGGSSIYASTDSEDVLAEAESGQYYQITGDQGDGWLELQVGETKAYISTKDVAVVTKSAMENDGKAVETELMTKEKKAEAAREDLVLTSACNYYDGVTQKEAEDFYNAMKDPKDETPVSYGLNSRLVKENGKIQEKIWKVGGLYGQAIDKIVYWLKKAEGVAENPEQKAVIAELIKFYETGDLKTFDEYAILWVKDLNSLVDFVNGFTESYGDPLGMKASWESLVNFKDMEATHRTEIISGNAQWFEDHSPVDKQFKKDEVKGVSAKVITAAILAGDLYPATAIGINLPNSNWIRSHHGSKSVTIGNITDAYNKAAHGNGFNEEFVYSDAELQLIDKYADLTGELHTDLHECLGHGSGKLLPGVDPDALKAYGSTIEEARADLFGLYYVADPKLVELGLTPNEDAYKAEYYTYLMNGLMTQLVRIEPGNDVEEAHMRNRQLIARWVFEKGAADKVVELVRRDGKTYVVVNDYGKLRTLFGELLSEIQRIKSTGDYQSAHDLVENYAVKVDPVLHAEVLERYKKLNLAPYKGFVNPKYEAVVDAAGKITDVKVTYDEGYAEQMLRYSKDYSNLPSINN